MSLRHRVALWSLAATVFAIPWQEAVVIPGVGSVVRIVGALALVLTALSTLEPGGFRVRSLPSLFIAAGIYVLWTVLSFFWTVDVVATSSTISTHAQLLLLMWAIWQLSAGPRSRRLLAQAYVLGSFVAAVSVINVFAFHSEQVNLDGRTTALGGNHNDIAAVMAIALAMAWWLASVMKGSDLRAFLYLAYVPIGLVAILLTGSRGGALAACLALGAVVLSLGKVRHTTRVLLALVLFCALVTAASLPRDIWERALPAFERVRETPELIGSSSLTGRTEIWRAGYMAVRESPIIGFGGDAFPAAVRYWLGYAKSAHNSFLSVAVNTGLIGLVLFCTMFLVTLLRLHRRVPSASRTTEVTIFVVLVVCMFPLGWEYYKSTWFVLAWLNSSSLPKTPAIAVASLRGPMVAAVPGD